MKTKFKLLAATITAIAMAVALPVLLFMGPPQSEGAAVTTYPASTSPYYANMTLGTNLVTIAASSTVTANGTAITLEKNSGLVILPKFATDAGASANITFTFQVSADGTTYSTTSPLTYAVASNGTTPVVGYKYYKPFDDLNGVRYVRLSSIQNATTNIFTLTQLQYSYWP